MKRIEIWLRAARIHLIFLPLLSVALGAVLAWRDGFFSPDVFGSILLMAAAFHVGAHLIDEYFDYWAAVRPGAVPADPPGGERFIRKGGLLPDDVFIAAMVAYASAIMLGLYLTFRSGFSLLLFGLTGALLSFFYAAPPLKLYSRGWGEPAAGLLLGPVCVIGTHYASSLIFSESAVIFSIPVAFLGMAFVHLSGMTTAERDRAMGRRHWAARMNREQSAGTYYVLIAAAYASILVPVLFDLLPLWTLFSLASLPLAFRACRTLGRNHPSGSFRGLVGMSLKAHFSTEVFLIFGLLLDFWGRV